MEGVILNLARNDPWVLIMERWEHETGAHTDPVIGLLSGPIFISGLSIGIALLLRHPEYTQALMSILGDAEPINRAADAIPEWAPIAIATEAESEPEAES